MSTYEIGRDVQSLRVHLEKLAQNIEELQEDVRGIVGNSSVVAGRGSAREGNEYTFGFPDLFAGPACIKECLGSIFRNGLCRFEGKVGNSSKHSFSDITVGFDFRNPDGVIVGSITLDQGGYPPKTGCDPPRYFRRGEETSPIVIAYFDRFVAGEFTVWLTLHRRKT
ncbi:MAG: hypothetical protein SFU86_00515 [Pirellulaceae bacterium]|nr:hypothetical protein [Pirellulaceae bacterium]